MTTAAPLNPTAIHNLSSGERSEATPAASLAAPNAAPTAAPTAPSPATAPSLATAAYPIPRGPVTSTLSFHQSPPDGSAPFNYVEQQPQGQPQRNFDDIKADVEIHDVRGNESHFSLDRNAFQPISAVPPSAEREWADDEHIKAVYYPEVERLLLEHVPGASRVFFFDHTIRRPKDAARAPVLRVHVDQTAAAAEARVRRHLPDEADHLLKSRYRIINVWRPLNGPVASFPLAMADGATVADEDLVSVEHRYPDRTGYTAGVRHNPNQRWHYWSGMTDDERLLLKCFDSDATVGRWGRVPHTAFEDPRTPENAPGRESIEVRTLVFG
ncbi:MAG: hypothetical protein M1832_005436 [Thelocarpon impressellum]|nr:MAG: hypothetical protein M1832_005436 [Thelocarpon impressellum]